jgi:hypothetical protein
VTSEVREVTSEVREDSTRVLRGVPLIKEDFERCTSETSEEREVLGRYVFERSERSGRTSCVPQRTSALGFLTSSAHLVPLKNLFGSPSTSYFHPDSEDWRLGPPLRGPH